MKRIALSALIAIGVHGLLLSADFNLRRGSSERADIPDRLTVVMLPAPGPVPAKKDLPVPPPPPAPELMADIDLAKIPAVLPQRLPDVMAAVPAPRAKPKTSLKARTFKPLPTPPEPEPEPQPAVQPQLQASSRAEEPAPAPAPPAAQAEAAAAASEKPVPPAAAYRPRKHFPDRPAVPLLERNPPPVYPESARRRGYQGAVMLKVLVGPGGGVEEVEVDQSCGYGILDRAALSAVRDWRFKPGVRDGEKTRMWVRVPVRFELK